MADRILRGGRVVDPKNGLDGVADVVIENGRIAAVTPHYEGHAPEETDCTGLVVCPGSSTRICTSAAPSGRPTACAWRRSRA